MALDKKKSDGKKKLPETNPQTVEEKKKAIDTAIAQIEKAYGAGAVMRLGATKTYDVDFIPTGSMTLDMALGIGGVP
ncbi:MAG: DNA recombination/repair protein RecA, partial [Oscillospiraceae bacterium]